MDNILVAVTVIGAVVMGATQVVKKQIPNNQWLPVINIIAGIMIGVVYAVTIDNGDIAVYGWAGAISGMAAGGFYDLGANAKGMVSKKEGDAK